jgi:hypothetical protein
MEYKSRVPKYIVEHLKQYAKQMQKARKHETEIRDWMEKYGACVNGNREEILDAFIDTLEYGTGDYETIIAIFENMLMEVEDEGG